MLIIMATIKIKPEHKQDFIKEMLGDAIGANHNEPGCLRFDVLQDLSDPNCLHLYEVYKDEVSLEEHRRAPHYLKWKDAVQNWRDGEAVGVLCSNIFPDNDNWR